MNNDLISREALKQHIIDIFEIEEKVDKKWAMGLKYSLKIIDNAPTVERPQGEWIMDKEHTKNPLLWYKCNLCGAYHSPTNFCPNCGADMRKGGAEE